MGKGPLHGEAAHRAGSEGARRAKRWLDSTSRVDACWVNPDEGARQKLTFAWPYGGQTFSFDLGGHLRYESFAGDQFYAEVKNYTQVSDLGTHWKDFLAKCYVAYLAFPAYADHFMWLSWTPHGVTKWATMTSADEVKAAVVAHASQIFPPEGEPVELVDNDVCAAVSERLWVLILSEKQEKLVPSAEHLGMIHAHELSKEFAS